MSTARNDSAEYLPTTEGRAACEIVETVAPRVKFNGVTVFTVVSGRVIGNTKSGGRVIYYNVSAREMMLKYLQTAPPHEVEEARKVIESRVQ